MLTFVRVCVTVCVCRLLLGSLMFISLNIHVHVVDCCEHKAARLSRSAAD